MAKTVEMVVVAIVVETEFISIYEPKRFHVILSNLRVFFVMFQIITDINISRHRPT